MYNIKIMNEYNDFTTKVNDAWNRTIMLRYLNNYRDLPLKDDLQNILIQQQYEFIHYLCDYFGIKDFINKND